MSEAGHLLDTNVLSEVRRPRPNSRVVAFLTALRGTPTFVSVLTLGELRRGAELKRRGDRELAGRIDQWIEDVESRYAERILGVDRKTADAWGRLSALRSRPVVDALIAATAIVHDLTLVTRNTRDFADTGVALVNPWE